MALPAISGMFEIEESIREFAEHNHWPRPLTKVPGHFCIRISKCPVRRHFQPEIRLARHRPSQSRCCSNASDGAPFQLFPPICSARTEKTNPWGGALGPESGAGAESRSCSGGRRFWMQMHRGKRVGLSSASSEFQEKIGWVTSAASVLPSGFSMDSAFRRAFLRIDQEKRSMRMPPPIPFSPARGAAATTLIPSPRSFRSGGRLERWITVESRQSRQNSIFRGYFRFAGNTSRARNMEELLP